MAQVPVPPPTSPVPSSGAPSERAGFWKRFGASLLDGILLGVVGGLIGALLGEPSVGYYGRDPAGSGISFILGLAYYIYFHGSTSGQTVGKKVLGIRVMRLRDAAPLGYGSAALRYVASFLSALPLGLGYFWMLWDDEKQTWHDKIAGSVVVPESAAPVENWPN